MLDEIRRRKQFVRYVPIIGWTRSYRREWLRDDLVSGVVVGMIMIPVAMAYAQMAGVPPQAGLYSAIVGMAAYSLLATSRHLKITTSSTMSIMSLAVVAPLAAGDSATLLLLSSALAITVGVLLLALSLTKLGFISDFLAKSVMTGYIFGVACLIAISQLPKMFGVPGGSGTFFEQVRDFVSELAETNPYALALGLGAIILILVIRRFWPLVPGALVALILGTVITSVGDLSSLHGVSVVGTIPSGMPAPAIPHIGLSTLAFLISGAAGMVLLATGETLGTGRSFAAKYHYEVDADQELFAMGAANIASGLFKGITIDMSLSSTASGETAGERTQISTLVSAGLILLVVVLLSPLLRNVPSAVLGAIVLSSIFGLFNIAEFRRYYRQRKTDFYLAATALLGVLASDVMTGMVIAVILSLVMLLYRASRPYIAVLGREPANPHEYTDISRGGDAVPVAALAILRLDAPLYFFNANVARTQILAQTGTDPPPRVILIDLGATADLDIGTSDMLWTLVSDLRDAGITLQLAEVVGSVRDRMRLTGLLEHIGADNIFPSVDAAVRAFESQGEPTSQAASAAQPAG
jgi:SulP family sulfate permease